MLITKVMGVQSFQNNKGNLEQAVQERVRRRVAGQQVLGVDQELFLDEGPLLLRQLGALLPEHAGERVVDGGLLGEGALGRRLGVCAVRQELGPELGDARQQPVQVELRVDLEVLVAADVVEEDVDVELLAQRGEGVVQVGDYVPAEVVVVEVAVGGRGQRAGEVGGEEALDGPQLAGEEAVQARLDQRHLQVNAVQVRGREDGAPLLVVGGVVGD